MKTLEKAQDKIKKISEELRREALEPAHAEAKDILEKARIKAAEVVSAAEKQAEKLLEEVRQVIVQERNVFQSSLQQAAKQAIEALKQSIEKRLFNDQLQKILKGQEADPAVIARLIDAIVNAIKKEGLSADISATIPKVVSVEEVNRLLAGEVLNALKNHAIELGDFAGGVKIKLIDKNMVIDMSEESLKEMLAKYMRKDFRKLIFAPSTGQHGK